MVRKGNKMSCSLKFILILFFIPIFSMGKNNQNKFGIKIGLNTKFDLKLFDSIYPISDSTNYIPNTGPSLESGMKANPVLLPKFRIQFNYIPKFKYPIEFISSILFEKRGQNYKEYYPDINNDFNEIKYIYSFFQFGVGVSYSFKNLDINILGKVNKLINTEVVFYPKNSEPFVRDYPAFHWFLTPRYSIEMALMYNLFIESKYHPSIGLTIEPLLHKSKAYTIGVEFSLNII